MFEDVEVDRQPAPCAFLITGIPGSGKTTVARALARCFPLAAHVDDDAMAAMIVSGARLPSPFQDDKAARQILLRARNAALLIDSFAAAGVVPVFDDVVVRRAHLGYYREMVRTRPFHVVVLASDPDVALRRDRERTKHMGPTWRHLDAALRDELRGEGIWVDSSDLAVDETVAAILTRSATPVGKPP